MDSASKPKLKSSTSVVILLTLMPASGLNSNVVTTGPGLICTTLPRTLNSFSLVVMLAAVSFNSCASKLLRSGASFSREVEGNSK